MERLTGLIGILLLIGTAYGLSNNRKRISMNIVGWGLGLQIIFAFIILKTPIGRPFFTILDKIIKKLIGFSDAGSDFLFKSFVPDVGYHVAMVNFAFRALPVIIFFSSLIALIYHFGIIQFIIKWIARGMKKTKKTSGAETLSISSNIFVGQTEAPIIVRPFIASMTHSELMAIMTGGFATVAGSVLALYVSWLGYIEGIAGHLLAASVMSAPAALMIAKIIYPETKTSQTAGDLRISIEKQDTNAMDALGRGATDGLKLAANVGAMLIAFVSIIAMINYILGFADTSMQALLGFIFKPLAWSMGVPWEEAGIIGSLMGEKIVLTELVAYGDLGNILKEQALTGKEILSERSVVIASYALCGFANFGSIGIQLGGIGAMAPERRKDLAELAIKAMIGGALASWMTATIAGMLI